MFGRALALAGLLIGASAGAEELHGEPSTYERLLRGIKPGDTLILAPGVYRAGLTLHGVKGTAASPIEIRGPAEGAPAVFVARPGADTLSLSNAAFLQIRHLVLDGAGLAVDAIKASGSRRCHAVHDIVLEDLLIVGHGVDQQVVGIASFCPAWNWTIRRNVIIGAGTGLYLGQSDGTAPFVGGLIEQNAIFDTRGYNLQIKHQNDRPSTGPIPTGARKTIIRHNLFTKARQSSSDKDARPNVLLGHFPRNGEGSEDTYEVSNNLFFCSPGESLLQGEGNLHVSGNIFFNPAGDGVAIQPHRDAPRRVVLRRNFVAAARNATHVSGAAPGHTPVVEENRIVAPEAVAPDRSPPPAAALWQTGLPALQAWLKTSSRRKAHATEFRPLTDFAGAACGGAIAARAGSAVSVPALADHPACRVVSMIASDRADIRSPAVTRSASAAASDPSCAGP